MRQELFQPGDALLLWCFQVAHVLLEFLQLLRVGRGGLGRRGDTQTPINQQGSADQRTPDPAVILRTQFIPHCWLPRGRESHNGNKSDMCRATDTLQPFGTPYVGPRRQRRKTDAGATRKYCVRTPP